MRLFTKLFLSAALVLPSLFANAATIVVEVGDNFFLGPNGTSTITMATSDVLEFQSTGANNHPTASNLWATFTMSPSNTRKVFQANSFTPGTYSFRCTAHAGMSGTLIVTLASSATDGRLTAPVLNLFPNPSKGGQVTVKFDQRAGQDYKLRLNNIIGREIRMVALKPELTENGLLLDLSDLPSGMYFYSLLLNDKVISTKRLVLQN